jgi:hypothetical protein
MSRQDITMEFQRRYHYDDMEKIGGFNTNYHTAVCDAVPDLSRSLQYDWDRKEIPKFDYYMDKIRETLATPCTEEFKPPRLNNFGWLNRSKD